MALLITRRRGVKAAPFLYCIEISCQRSVLRQKDRSQVSGRRFMDHRAVSGQLSQKDRSQTKIYGTEDNCLNWDFCDRARLGNLASER